MIPTGMVLIGSSAAAGLLAIFLFALVHHMSQRHHDISFLSDFSRERLHHISSDIRHIRVIRHSPKNPLLNYHHRHQERLSHVELHHKDGKISRIHPENEHEREILMNKIRTMESKLSYYGLPKLISYA